jgi:CRISPR-associated protein Cmr4
MSNILFLYTETSLHAGTGSTVSVVDLPIQRERTTNLPIVAGSGLKGALRAQFTGDATTADVLFGPEKVTRDDQAYAGAVAIGDARIVLFPVRSLMGVFAFTTSHLVLSRLLRDLGSPRDLNLSKVPVSGEALVTSNSDLKAGAKVVLEEFSFTAVANADLDNIAKWLGDHALPGGSEYQYWRSKLMTSLIVLPDNDFRDFCQTSTEIATRVRLERGSKTVAQGALWTEESLPADCLLYAPVVINNARDGKSGMTAETVAQALGNGIPGRIQLGGDETTGSGFTAIRWL